MAKRFTDTNKYRDVFFRDLPAAYKILWDYIQHDCDHAGIWIVDFRVARIYVGDDLKLSQHEALKLFNEGEQRIFEIDNGKRWFIRSFVDFQYGKLNPENRAHKSVILLLEKFSLYKNNTLISPLEGAKDKEKDMVQSMDTDKDKAGVKIEDDYYSISEKYSNENVCWMLRNDIDLHNKGAALKNCEMKFMPALMEKFVLTNCVGEEFTRDTYGMIRKHFQSWVVGQDLPSVAIKKEEKPYNIHDHF